MLDAVPAHFINPSTLHLLFLSLVTNNLSTLFYYISRSVFGFYFSPSHSNIGLPTHPNERILFENMY